MTLKWEMLLNYWKSNGEIKIKDKMTQTKVRVKTDSTY